MLGAQEYAGRFDEIRGEWRLDTRAKVQKRDPALFRLLTDKRDRWPTRLPDGKYREKKRRR